MSLQPLSVITMLLQFILLFITITQTGGVVIKDLDVQCSEHEMTVYISFYSAFDGIIFSKGYYDNQYCHYVRERTGYNKYKFQVPIDGCGTKSKAQHPTKDVYKYIENTLVMQEDPYIQGMHDLARNVRCVWKRTFSKVVTARPVSFNSVPLVFTSRSINQVTPLNLDTSPFDHPVSGYIYMGQQTSMVVYIQDPNHIFDANLKGCQIVDKKGARMLLDSSGCYNKKNMMTPFYKTNATGDSGASMMFYSYFKDFKLSHRDKFAINCEMEVCTGKCNSKCKNPVFTRGKRETHTFLPAKPEPFQSLANKPQVSNDTSASKSSCTSDFSCTSTCWIILMCCLAILALFLFILSTIFCCKLIKYNDYIAQKTKIADEPLIA